MNEHSPRVIESGRGHGSGESYERSDLDGVNLVCEHGETRQLVSAIYFDPETGEAFPRDGTRRVLEDLDGTVRSRWKFRCVQCNRTVVVRAENLNMIISKLVRHGVSELNLIGLDGILRRN
jgi:hypothetical protein